MVSLIPFNLQYHVEVKRNNKYEWLMFVLTVLVFALHGLLFHWLPGYFRSKRDPEGVKYQKFFKFLKIWDSWTNCIGIKVPFKKNIVYFQPSLVLLALFHSAVLGVFCIVQTVDLDYQPRQYIICKRMLKVAVGNLPMIMILLMKHDLVTAISGLQHDRLVFVHKWLSRSMWVLITTHFLLAIKYWLDLNFPIMLVIPPQIFGLISYVSFVFLTWASNKWIRKWSYEFFLIQHRVFGFIMLFLAFIHNPGNRAAVLISVHLLVFDRVLLKVLGAVHRRMSPTKGLCDFEILDNDTLLVTIPVKKTKFAKKTWYTTILPKFSTWDAGQHVYLNVGKISFFQYHPFTISNLEEDGEIKLVVRKQKGFTKKLYNKLIKMKQEEMNKEHNISIEESPSHKNKLQLKAQFIGPFGAKHQPFLGFDRCLFIGAGSGGSFTFPVALKLVQDIKQRDEANDFLFRPANQFVHLVWIIRNKENEQWFQHMIEPLYDFIQEGRIKLTIYITQEEPEITQERGNNEKTRIFKESVDSIEFQTSVYSKERFAIERHYGRPDISNLINSHANVLSDSVNTKSLSVCSCGPELLTNRIKVECQKSRWVKDAPDIYCYSESF
ncbi:uncharacterized protein CANTADRAFT_68603 [Suhomyces tanzawaensis NRRL Y-17324]|uniref:ferric-chelate reductase (NADPH) n=1 Tax=Suhomyces tanzawaensis NRRL Y-17324 TaxID=984487 RepID=A0A1E4SDX8_9ASCO|nr:uncharacterized protein CANTADRAFT_68603 [Suhomyces tanzawaensis NRRL Y-17324]ODV77683.1 hypothetical protein CANTADRAFT_68603 [Suhomyces tanzawaensis NRRL Y-17324]